MSRAGVGKEEGKRDSEGEKKRFAAGLEWENYVHRLWVKRTARGEKITADGLCWIVMRALEKQIKFVGKGKAVGTFLTARVWFYGVSKIINTLLRSSIWLISFKNGHICYWHESYFTCLMVMVIKYIYLYKAQGLFQQNVLEFITKVNHMKQWLREECLPRSRNQRFLTNLICVHKWY